MYHNQFIVLIQKDGHPLRETEGKFVYLPFQSEYSIHLKNQSWRRAIASIKIDGTDVLGGRELIIPAYGSSEVERFLTDGNLNSGKKLKFVPLSDSKVQDPSSPENGLVEIEVWYERIPNWTITYMPSISDQWKPEEWTTGGASRKIITNNMFYCSSNMPAMTADMNTVSVSSLSARGEAGATVEGGQSNQSFVDSAFGQKDYPSTTFKFWLRGAQQEVTTEDKLYCTNCGKKMRFDYKYCPRCGSPSQIA